MEEDKDIEKVITTTAARTVPTTQPKRQVAVAVPAPRPVLKSAVAVPVMVQNESQSIFCYNFSLISVILIKPLHREMFF